MMRSILFAVLGFSVISVTEAQHACLWQKGQLQDLGSLGGTSSASGINDTGQVTGYSFLADGITYHAFLWSADRGMADLGAPADYTNSRAYGINLLGHVVGIAHDIAGNTTAFFWSAESGFAAIGEANIVLSATAINDHDEVTGTFYSGGVPHSFLWSPQGSLRDLGIAPNGASSYGLEINNRLMIVGYGSIFANPNDTAALLWTRRSGFVVVASLQDGLNYANGINDKGEIVGTRVSGSGVFAWDVDPSGNLTVLEGLDGANGLAFAINRRGMIVGASYPPTTPLHAVRWRNAQSAPQDLGTFAGGTTSVACAVNNRGQIVGVSDGTASP